MIKFPSSIRQKIMIGYMLSFVVIIAGAVFTYINLRMTEDRITFSHVIGDIFDTALEIRRFEKNYFLYTKEEDYRENLFFINKAEELIEKNKEEFKRLLPTFSVAELQARLQEYKELMREDFLLNKGGRTTPLILKGEIREKGREIVKIAEDISKAGKENIQRLLLTLQRILITATIFLVIVGIVFGYVLLHTITKPLRLLQDSMERISRVGWSERVSIDSSDREIISLSEAFNRMLRELEWRQRQLVQSEKLASMGTLLSGTAHELNNPLSNISTSCQILLEELEESDISYKKELLQQIEDQVERSKNIVHSILQFSREKEFKSKPFPLKDLVDDTLMLIKGDIPTGVEVIVDIPEDCCVIVDKQRIQQALLNIIKNAIESIPDEGRVSVSAEKDLYTKSVKIKIQDTGIGVEDKNLSKIFDPFFTTKEGEKGYGLGLFVAHNIIEEHGGTIDVESELGYGTTFLIRLPLKELKNE